MKKENIHLLGASGHARVILDILKSRKQPVGEIYDANPAIRELQGHPVLPQREMKFPLLICIGDNYTRARLANQLNGPFASAVAASATISSSATISEGSVVMQGAIIQAGSRIGRHAIVNTVASVDHDCIVGDFVHISPHAALCGNVTVGEGTHIGAGATVIQGVTIGKWCCVGAGAVVIHDVPDGATVVGVPAQEIHRNYPFPFPLHLNAELQLSGAL
ncbi:MAG: acetyltransferase [Bacteroidales bacterium]